MYLVPLVEFMYLVPLVDFMYLVPLVDFMYLVLSPGMHMNTRDINFTGGTRGYTCCGVYQPFIYTYAR